MNVERERARSRRPITDEEVPALEALGQGIRAARTQAGLSIRDLAWLANLSRGHVIYIEHGLRRTRVSTLRRIAEAIASESGGDADALHAHFVALGEGGIAPESAYAERVGRRSERRKKRKALIEARAHELAVGMAIEMAKDHIRTWQSTGKVPRR